MYYQKISVPDLFNLLLKITSNVEQTKSKCQKMYEKHREKCTQKRNLKNFKTLVFWFHMGFLYNIFFIFWQINLDERRLPKGVIFRSYTRKGKYKVTTFTCMS